MNPAGAAVPFNSASLYVGDLHPDVSEAQLFDVFKQIGPVASIRVCRDAVTRRSLGYAYVNYYNVVDAERALDLLNYKELRGRPVRIMWSQRDPNMRRSNAGNIFIKNLDKSIDNKQLYDTFATFGNILSCKVVMDEHGNSLGYGFVHYEQPESAQLAIEKTNNKQLNGKVIFVGQFVPRKERADAAADKWTNVFIKNLPGDTTEEELRRIVAEFGNVTSAVLKFREAGETDDELDAPPSPPQPGSAAAAAAASGASGAASGTASGTASASGAAADGATTAAADGDKKAAPVGTRRGFAFANFERHEQAVAAVNALNGREMRGCELFVGKAQKKSEREKELRANFERLKKERMSKYQGVNCFVKNLDDVVDEERLRKEFEHVGAITSCVIMRDDKRTSKGFGFVCFSTPDEANKAVTDMNGKMIESKPIYVALAERKDQRRAKLEAQFAQRSLQAMRMGGMPMGMPMQVMPGGPYPGIKYNQNVRNQPAVPSLPELQLMPTVERKQVLGEALFPLINNALKSLQQQELSGKITGMLLESMEAQDLLELLDNSKELDKKIGEALEVLEVHAAEAHRVAAEGAAAVPVEQQ